MPVFTGFVTSLPRGARIPAPESAIQENGCHVRKQHLNGTDAPKIRRRYIDNLHAPTQGARSHGFAASTLVENETPQCRPNSEFGPAPGRFGRRKGCSFRTASAALRFQLESQTPDAAPGPFRHIQTHFLTLRLRLQVLILRRGRQSCVIARGAPTAAASPRTEGYPIDQLGTILISTTRRTLRSHEGR
jgi:hypothetical protein